MSLTNNTTKLNEILDTVNSLPSAVSLDSTLTVAGKAADAKAVGDALAEKQPIGDYALKSEIPTAGDLAEDFAAASHNQAASTITAGTFAGKVQGNASAMTTLSTAQVRDISAGTEDLTAGTSPLATGTLYFVYE